MEPRDGNAPGGERIALIDALRGFAIVLVVVGHAIQVTDTRFDINLAFRLIYSFHMPLLFFISGLVSRRAVRRPFGQLLRNRATTLLLPFVTWWLLLSVWQSLTGGPDFASSASMLLRSPDTGLWFLWVLFAVTLLAAATLKVARTLPDAASLAVAAVLLLAIRVPLFGIEMIGWYFPFFAAGLLLAQRFADDDRGSPRLSRTLWLLAILIWFVLALGWRRVGLVSPVDALLTAQGLIPRLVDVGYRYATAAAGIAASVAFIRLLAAARGPYRALQYLGQNTLEIYVAHSLFLGPFARAGLMWAPFAAVVAIAASLLLANLLKRVSVLRLALYGGRTATAT